MHLSVATPRPARGIKWLAAGVLLAISATLALTAWAAEPGRGGHPPHGEDGGYGPFMGSPHGLDRMLDGVNASEAQRTQIKQIMQQAMADLKAQRETTRSLRERSVQIFTAPTVDAAAAESLRQQMLAQHDAASKRMLQAMLDVSRVLTPDQRKQLGDLMAQQRAKMEARRAERAAQKPGQ